MNVIAGAAIGWISDDWTTRLLLPLLWSGVFVLWRAGCALSGIGTAAMYVARFQERKIRRPFLTFCGMEYFTGTVTSLPFSVIAGVISMWLR